MKKKIMVFALTGILALTSALCCIGLTACGGEEEELTKVTVQIKWLKQAQFMGYYAADALGFYEAEGLDVTIAQGGSVNEIDEVTNGRAQFGVTWTSNLINAVANGSNITTIAQIYKESGMTALGLKSNDGIADGTKFSQGETIENWMGGNQYELQALIAKYGLTTQLQAEDYDMDEFLNGSVDWSSAMTYNELGLVLESKKADGSHYTLDDLYILNMQDEGVGMLEDNIFVDTEWASANTETTEAFLRASIKGWAWCYKNPLAAGSLVYTAGDSISEYHQQYMAKEVAKLLGVTDGTLSTLGEMVDVDFTRTKDQLAEYSSAETAAAISALSLDDVRYSTFWTNAMNTIDLSDLDTYTYEFTEATLD